jgi:hypothetical protein
VDERKLLTKNGLAAAALGMIWRIGIALMLPAALADAQNRPLSVPSLPAPGSSYAGDGADVSGKWTYRSFINIPDLVGGDPQKALNLIFGEGVFSFAVSASKLSGTLDLGSGFVLDLQGTVQAAGADAPLTFAIAGLGRANTPTAGWEYDYRAYVAYRWPNGVDQVPALVGSVIRAKPHDGAPAGFVASFIAVKQP